MKTIFSIFFAAALLLSIAFIGDATSTNNPFSAQAQTRTGRVTVTRKRSGGVVGGTKYVVHKTKRGAIYAGKKTYQGGKYVGKKGYEGGKYVGTKTVQGGKYVGTKTVKTTKYVGKKTVNGTKSVFSKTKKVVTGN